MILAFHHMPPSVIYFKVISSSSGVHSSIQSLFYSWHVGMASYGLLPWTVRLVFDVLVKTELCPRTAASVCERTAASRCSCICINDEKIGMCNLVEAGHHKFSHAYFCLGLAQKGVPPKPGRQWCVLLLPQASLCDGKAECWRQVLPPQLLQVWILCNDSALVILRLWYWRW